MDIDLGPQRVKGRLRGIWKVRRRGTSDSESERLRMNVGQKNEAY